MSPVDPTHAGSAHADQALTSTDVEAPALAASTASQALENRYGSARRRRFDRRFALWTAGALVLACIGFFFFSGWQTTSQIDWQDIGYTKKSELVLEARFEVTGPANTAVACAVEALNTSKATVGWKIIEIPPSDKFTHTISTKLVTTTPATAVTTRECWVVV